MFIWKLIKQLFDKRGFIWNRGGPSFNIKRYKRFCFYLTRHCIYTEWKKMLLYFWIFTYIRGAKYLSRSKWVDHNQILILGFNQENARKTENSPKYMNDCVRSLTNIAEHELDAAEQQQERKINLIEFILKTGLPKKED